MVIIISLESNISLKLAKKVWNSSKIGAAWLST